MKTIVALCMLLITSSAFAELATTQTNLPSLGSIQGLSAEASSLALEVPSLNATIEDTISVNANILKEAKVYRDDQKQKLAALEVAKANVIATVKTPLENKQAEQAREYNAQCERTFNRETQMDQYNRCLTWKANLEAEFASNNQWWTNFVAQWNAQNVEPINEVIQKQNARLAELKAQYIENAKRYNAAMERMKLVRARIAQITGIISGFCHSENLSGEAMKWCTNVDWDGASRNLPPLTTFGTGGASAN